ncbi:MAG TPA: c-type cytochrome [Kofleriaceae bacterium]|nr:c-type cytochrome [Kofleriaceae bacterium]
MSAAIARAAAAAACLLAAACGGEISGAERGEELFSSPSLSPSELNPLACADCHETGPGDGPTSGLPGYRLHGAAARPRYWGGDHATLRGATDACLVFFMKGEPLDPEAEEFHALYEFLLSLTPDDAPGEAYPFTVVENVADVPRGDAARGAEVYERACRGCHGEAFTGGDGSILRTPVPLPGVTETYPAEFPGVDPSLVVIEKVRHGRFFGIGGEMPLFSAEAMSDEDLGALLSYLEL